MIRKSVKKTDRNDARALAFFLSKDMLPQTRPKTRAESELASVTHTRDLLVKQRTRLLNKIHALHNRHGIKLKKESLSSKRRLMALDIGRFAALEQIELRVVRDRRGAGKAIIATARKLLTIIYDTVQARDLIRIANALRIPRVVIVGDEKQLDAVDAGKPFAQLQQAGMTTAVMDEILRQKDPELREAVEAAVAGDVTRAFEKLGDRVPP